MPPTTFWEDIRHFSFKYWVSFTLVCVCIHTQADACVLKNDPHVEILFSFISGSG
jgi:hypothetical protein